MEHDSLDEDLKRRQSVPSSNFSRQFGRRELYLLLLTFAIGITIDYWFNNHQLLRISSSNPNNSSVSAPSKSQKAAQTNLERLFL